MRCRHRASYAVQRWDNGVCLGVERRHCMDCNEALPLGPARDTPETAIELRAAELAADEGMSKFSQREWAGWCGESDYIELPDVTIQKLDYEHDVEWRAGYLAHDIETDGNWDGGEIERNEHGGDDE